MAEFKIPLWVEILTAIFVLAGAFVALLGASGVLRLKSFFARVHAPAIVTTVGIWCILLATLFFFTGQTGRLPINTLLIGLFISVTTPVTTIFLMRAALFRSRQRGEDVPPSINNLRLAVPQKVEEESEEDEDAVAQARQQPAAASNASPVDTSSDTPAALAPTQQPAAEPGTKEATQAHQR